MRSILGAFKAHIGTIHGFCSDLLRERPVEAKVDPLFEVAAEDEKERIYEECFERWFQRELNAPREGVRRMLRRLQYHPRKMARAGSSGRFRLSKNKPFSINLRTMAD